MGIFDAITSTTLKSLAQIPPGFMVSFANWKRHLSEFEKQASWPRKWEIPLKIVAAFGIGRAWVSLQNFAMVHVLHIQPITPRPHWVDAVQPFASVIRWGLSFGVGCFPGIFLTNKLLELWPSVELRMGRE